MRVNHFVNSGSATLMEIYTSSCMHLEVVKTWRNKLSDAGTKQLSAVEGYLVERVKCSQLARVHIQ